MIENVVICGGGSGGHALPAITVIRSLHEFKPSLNIICLGSHEGIEAILFPKERVSYHPIATGKLRRYFSWQNFTDIFRILLGVAQSFFILLKLPKKKTVLFCTGGFVTVPVVLAAWFQGKKIYIHEQTSRVGLANKICSFFADQVLISFEESKSYFSSEKVNFIGYPLRNEIFQKKSIPFDTKGKPVLFLTGGGNGSSLLNKTLFDLKEQLTKTYFIIHQCGKLEYDHYKKEEDQDYKVYDFIGEEMVALLDNADVVISRAGAGTVIELMALGKPSIFIPLKIAQKNEQLHNAKEAERKLGSLIIEENELNKASLLAAISKITALPKGERIKNNPTEKITRLLLGTENA